MEFVGLEALVIDALQTREIQRLRRVRQLGLAHLVFPGAEHSRLVHSLGAAFVAIQFGRHLRESSGALLGEALRPDEWSIKEFGLAALVHDLGHGPLSHIWEQHVVREPIDRKAWATALGLDLTDVSDRKWHEIATLGLLNWPDGDLHGFLESLDRGLTSRICAFLTGTYFLPYLPRLLASDIDVDRCDFLRRDAYQSGVAYGRYDLPWLISTCEVGFTKNNDLVVGFDKRKAGRVVEQFLVARSALYETVYHHKTVRAAEAMVGKFLRRFAELNPEGKYEKDARLIAPLVRILSGETVGPNELLALDDYALGVLLNSVADDIGADVTLRNLATRILARDLFKTVPVEGDAITNFMESNPDYSERLGRAVEPYVAGDPTFYWHIDRAIFSWFTPEDAEDHWGYFIDDASRATPIRAEFRRRFPPESVVTRRLFTVKEAVADITKLFN